MTGRWRTAATVSFGEWPLEAVNASGRAYANACSCGTEYFYTSHLFPANTVAIEAGIWRWKSCVWLGILGLMFHRLVSDACHTVHPGAVVPGGEQRWRPWDGGDALWDTIPGSSLASSSAAWKALLTQASST